MYLRSSLFRDQSVFITWGGPKELRGGGVTRNWVAERGGATHLKILLGGGIKNIYCPVGFAILISNVNMVL